MGLGRCAWIEARETLQQLLGIEDPRLRDDAQLRQRQANITHLVKSATKLDGLIAMDMILLPQNWAIPVLVGMGWLYQIVGVIHEYLFSQHNTFQYVTQNPHGGTLGY